MTPVVESTGEASNAFEIFPEISDGTLPVNEAVQQAVQQVAVNTSNISIFGDMQDFIDNTDVAAICTIPADDMPVVDGDDIVIDNNNISLDFDAENLFEDFDEEEDAVGEEEEEEEADNDDENDNNDAATDQNLLLTSDDDDVDDFDDEQSKHLQKPYCIYCTRSLPASISSRTTCLSIGVSQLGHVLLVIQYSYICFCVQVWPPTAASCVPIYTT